MATLCSMSFSLAPKASNPYKWRLPSSNFRTNAANSSPSATKVDLSVSIDVLRRFIDLNVGKWNGSFYQFDCLGNVMHKVSTKLSASSYGEKELMSLIQTLYIRQPSSSTSVSGDEEEPEWAEYKIKETNMFTVDKYQQIGFFPKERAFALRYQTAGMLENVLRQGVLGEDDTGEESPKNLKLPSRRPSIVCENCLYSQEKDMRARAFHIMDPKGIVEMMLIFLEVRGDAVLVPPSLDETKNDTNRIKPFLGKWKGHSVTNRSGVYGGTITEADTTAIIEFDDKGQLIQDITSTSSDTNVTTNVHWTDTICDNWDITSTSSDTNVTTNVHWTGTICDNLVTFDGGFQLILLPGGMYMGCPCDISKSVAESKSFHLEFCWLESSNKRQRLIRTFDVEGLAVSSTYFSETKL